MKTLKTTLTTLLLLLLLGTTTTTTNAESFVKEEGWSRSSVQVGDDPPVTTEEHFEDEQGFLGEYRLQRQLS